MLRSDDKGINKLYSEMGLEICFDWYKTHTPKTRSQMSNLLIHTCMKILLNTMRNCGTAIFLKHIHASTHMHTHSTNR